MQFQNVSDAKLSFCYFIMHIFTPNQRGTCTTLESLISRYPTCALKRNQDQTNRQTNKAHEIFSTFHQLNFELEDDAIKCPMRIWHKITKNELHENTHMSARANLNCFLHLYFLGKFHENAVGYANDPETHKKLKRTLFHRTKQDRMRVS